ncbi:MAG: YabP/YqfC family sporulation protein [Clostridia bacterium]|nr:YabP/YqfC family sporulation protein [Clostridia bacterium]
MAIERVTRVQEPKTQSLTLENRESLSISGVNDVLNFSDTSVELDTSLGILKVSGENLKIISVSTEGKTAELIGKVNSLEYKKQHEKKSLWQSVFK